MRTNKLLSAFAIALCIGTATAQNNTAALIPMPNSVVQCPKGTAYTLNAKSAISTSLPEDAFCIGELQRIIKKRTGIDLPVSEKGNITVAVDTALRDEEHYTIDITKKGIKICGATTTALFRAVQTMDQILIGDVVNTAANKIASVAIDDAPRYEHRAIMLDPARHFLPVEDIKFFIDQMAKYKYNVLQLHLTDDQGWRVEIKSHPKLTEIGAFRNPNGGKQGPDNGFYTQDELKDIINYAALRGIEIIPELDIPGHSVAILAAYPELGCAFRQNEKKDLGNTTNMMLCANCDKAYEVYADIFRELAEVFPSKRIHLGGDEAAVKANWAKCDSCHALMKKNGYNEPEQLMNIFFGKMLDLVRANGKEPILWCELDNIWPPANDYLFPYPKDVILVTWRNALTPKCIELTRENGHKLIMAPGEHAYLDYPQYSGDLPEFNNWGMPVTTLEKTYELDPGYGLPAEERTHILGVMGTLWSEAIRDINRVTYMAFPRALALAEAGWSNMEQRSWDSFKNRLYPNITDLMKSGVSVRVPFEIAPRK